MPINLSRRRFLQLGAVTGASFYLSFHRLPAALASSSAAPDSPIFDLTGPFASIDFNGDDVRRPHEILWDVEGYIRSKGGRPTSFRREKVVVAGGGMAGLLSGYFLRDKKPVVLEQALQFGGNSKGERYQGSAYSLGAAYITVPDEGSSVDKFLKETGLDNGFRFEPPEDTRVVYHGVKSLWKGETDPAALESAEHIDRELKRIYDEAYPDIPWTQDSAISLEQLKALDRQNAQDWLRAADPKLHPHVEEYFQLYCWSSFGGSLEELSAAQFINFVAAETVGIRAFPAGNSAVTAKLHEKLSGLKGCLTSDSIVLEVKETANGVEVLYEDATGALKLIYAETAIVATPKYVASAIVKGADRELVSLWRTGNYRAYLVINVLLKEKAHSAAYDLFCLKGEVPEAPRFTGKKRPWCDFIFADWAASDQSGRSILTIYKPLPFDGGKSTIVDAIAHKRVQEEAMRELPALLVDLGLPEDGVEATRITRWGHALPLAKTGAIADGTVEKLSAPLGKIFFANQDNYLNPAFESSFAAAERAAAGVRAVLGG